MLVRLSLCITRAKVDKLCSVRTEHKCSTSERWDECAKLTKLSLSLRILCVEFHSLLSNNNSWQDCCFLCVCVCVWIKHRGRNWKQTHKWDSSRVRPQTAHWELSSKRGFYFPSQQSYLLSLQPTQTQTQTRTRISLLIVDAASVKVAGYDTLTLVACILSKNNQPAAAACVGQKRVNFFSSDGSWTFLQKKK